MISRSIYYASRLYTEQMKKSERYRDIGRTIALNIINFNLFSEEEFLNSYRFKNLKTNAELTNILEINFLELQKVPEELATTTKGMWAQFLSTDKEEVLDMLANRSEAIKKAVEKLKYVSSDEKMRFEYNQREKARLDYYADIKANREDGFEEGKIDTAKKMLLNKISIDIISRCTGLSEIEIIKLKSEKSKN